MKKIAIIVSLISFSLFADTSLNNVDSDTGSRGMSIGVKLMRMEYEKTIDPDDRDSKTEKTEFFAGVVPVSEFMGKFFVNGLYFYTNTNLTWGLTDFFFDFGFGTGLRYYPLNNPILSVYGGGEAGTFFFNNATLTARGGVDLDFKMNKETSSFLGAEVFKRESYHLIDYIEEEHWFISSPGWAINGGFRIKMDFFKDGIQGIPKTL